MAGDALDYITIEGFKSIASIQKLALRPANLVIGPNGSGKSNLIGAFGFLSEIREGRLRSYVTRSGGAEKLLHFGSKVTKAMKFDVSFEGGVNQYSITLERTSDDGLAPMSETVTYWNKSEHPQPLSRAIDPREQGREAGISDTENLRIGKWVHKRVGEWQVYHVHDTSASSPARTTAEIHDNRHLRVDGKNLPAFLYLLREKHPTEYALIRATIRRVAPFFDDFRLEPLRLNPGNIQLEWRHKNSDQYFDASSLSDGTLRFMILATLFLQPVALRPSLILIDEPELGLHPYAIEILAAMIRQASAETQVIVSTQSSLLLDHFDPEDVLVANRVEGATTIERLDPARLASWLEDYSLGQLWEKNEIGGRPAVE